MKEAPNLYLLNFPFCKAKKNKEKTIKKVKSKPKIK